MKLAEKLIMRNKNSFTIISLEKKTSFYCLYKKLKILIFFPIKIEICQ